MTLQENLAAEAVAGGAVPAQRSDQRLDSVVGQRLDSVARSARSVDELIWACVQQNPFREMWDFHGLSFRQVATRTWNGLNDDNLFGRASQLAYAFFSAIFPALIAMSSLLGLIAKSSNDTYIALLNRLGHLVPPAAFSLVMDTFKETTTASTTGKVILGLIVALFSASVGISALQDTLNTIYRVKETRAFWRARLEAIGLTILVSVLVIGALLILSAGDIAAKYGNGLFLGYRVLWLCLQTGSWAIASMMMILSFEVTYYFCPDVPNRVWKWFTPGGVIGLMGWIAGSMGLRVYLHYFNNYSVTYGSLGAVFILLLWFYVTGVMILLGGEVNAEVERATTERQIREGTCVPPSQAAIDKVQL
jgi:membrane protein